MLATHKIQQKQFHDLRQVFMLSAWGFHNGRRLLSVPLYRTSGGRPPGNHSPFHAGLLYFGNVSVHDAALSGSLRKKEGCLTE